ncbi:hypothetical protein B6U93_01135 [Candidatus Woesearchaeota archaeon ex4484_78]|nr:MAG: hypothetical protein B6U93_01135 [Candidatus Woesearchaeota archaeon ex4484_78]
MLEKKTTKRIGIRLFGFRILREKKLQQDLKELVKEKYYDTISYLLSYAANFSDRLQEKEYLSEGLVFAASNYKKELEELKNTINLTIFEIGKYITLDFEKFQITLNFLTKKVKPLIIDLEKKITDSSESYLEKKSQLSIGYLKNFFQTFYDLDEKYNGEKGFKLFKAINQPEFDDFDLETLRILTWYFATFDPQVIDLKPAKLKKLFLDLNKERIIQKEYEQEQLHYDFVASLTYMAKEVLMLKRNIGSWETIKEFLKDKKEPDEDGFFIDLKPADNKYYERIIEFLEEHEKKYQTDLSDYTRYVSQGG